MKFFLLVSLILTITQGINCVTANGRQYQNYHVRTLSGNGVAQMKPNTNFNIPMMSNPGTSYNNVESQTAQINTPVFKQEQNRFTSETNVNQFQERQGPINEVKVEETLQNAFTPQKSGQRIINSQPIEVIPSQKVSTLTSSPCTAEVLRMSDIMLFKDPLDKRSYLICTAIDMYHSMPCPEGTEFNDELHHCVPAGYEAPKCPDSFCKNDADCLVDETNQFKCICKVGFTGEFCEVNVDECALVGNQACAGGSCVDQINGYYCTYPNGLIGLKRESSVKNPCTLDNFAKDSYFFEVPSVNGDVWLQCIGELQFVVSRCAEHLFWNSELQTCTIEKPVAKSGVCKNLPCKNGGDCQDLGNSQFQCLCRDGFSGDLCEIVDDLCSKSPCANGGRCLSWPGGFTCVCQNKIIDETCTSGLTNPCPTRSNLIPGFNDYFAHTTPERYLQCDRDGRAFARSCPLGLKWKQDSLSCVSANSFSQKEFRQTTTPVSVRRFTVSTTSTFTPIERKFLETPKPIISNLQFQNSVPNMQTNFGQESRFQQMKPINTFEEINVNPSSRFTSQFDEVNRQPQSGQEFDMVRLMPNGQLSIELPQRLQSTAPAVPKPLTTNKVLKYRLNRAQY